MLFIDTDQVTGDQSFKECEIARIITETMCEGGVCEDNIGVVCTHRAQGKLLKRKLRSKIDILIAGRAVLGHDKECVIVSSTLPPSIPDEHQQDNDALEKYWSSLYLVFTRARSKLVIVGSCNAIRSSGPLANQFLKVVLNDKERWSCVLDCDALESDTFPKRRASSVVGQSRQLKTRVIGMQTAVEGIGGVTRDIIADLKQDPL